MLEKLIGYLEKRPRAVVAATLTFALAFTAVSGSVAYIVTLIIERDRAIAKFEIEMMKEQFDERIKLTQERAQQNSNNVVRAIDSLTPLLANQEEAIHELRREILKARIAEKTEPSKSEAEPQTAWAPKREEIIPNDIGDPSIYARVWFKLSELEFQTHRILRTLQAERIQLAEVNMPVTEAEPMDEFYLYYWIRRLAWVCFGVSVISGISLSLIFRKRK